MYQCGQLKELKKKKNVPGTGGACIAFSHVTVLLLADWLLGHNEGAKVTKA